MNAALAMADSARILVVDDNEMNRDMLSRRLERQGYQVAVASDGREALAMIEAQSFDLVLLDIMMPEMNGYELLEHLRGDPLFRHLPVILISALDDADSVVKGIEMGADDHLPKPFNPHILRARVGASLAKKRLHDREQMHARMLEREIDIAREIQAGFLPARLPQPDGWELAACFEPARQVGGDFYDAFALDDGRIVVAIADVCDKGVGAALFMALFRSLLRALAYVNGGHESPALVGAAGVRARLLPTGPAVGMLPGMEFTVAHQAIDAGEMLLLFTDGATDARNQGGALLGEEGMLVLANPIQGAGITVAALRDAVHAHAAGTDPFDDLTLMVVARA